MEQLIISASLAITLVAHIIAVSFREIRYQRTIDRLTDKLMARDYKEYASMNAPKEPEQKLREPKSWYDDPTIGD